MTREYRNERQKLYRDPDHGWIAGVCAGLARFLGVGRFVVRLSALVCLIVLTVPTIIAYCVLWLVLDRPPEQRRARRRNRHGRRDWNDMRSGVSDRMRSLDARIQDIEARVTSREFDLEEEFRRL